MEKQVENNKKEQFQEALEILESAVPYAKEMYQADALQAAARLMDEKDGMRILYEFADRFEEAGIFLNGPWAEPSKLLPNLVKGSLMSGGMTPIVEILSDIRMVSLAKEKHTHEKVSKKQAQDFLHEIMALNVDTIFPEETEAARIEGNEKEKKRAERLFEFLAEELSLKAISSVLIQEIDDLITQRPIMVNRTVKMIENAKQLLKSDINKKEQKAIEYYLKAIDGPTKLSQENDLKEYRKALQKLEDKELKQEAKEFAKYMRDTGLVSCHHTILVRFLNRNHPKLIPIALDLSSKGKANLEEHFSIVSDLIKIAIHPPLKQALYGLTRMLERGILSSTPVIPGLRRLIELDILPDVRKVLLSTINGNEGITANDILVAGTLSVLGQPLGVGQGMNPTCQTARGISLWSVHAPGYLLELIPRAARDGDIDIMFEGKAIHSKDLGKGLVEDLHEELGPVSLVLVPHLDKIYGELVRLVKFRGDDVHKWVNPAFYGNWVSRGFCSVIDPMTGSVADYSGFVRLFYSTHHPEYNEGYELIYPNPVGIFITNSFSDLLGLHAVSVQRIAQDPSGQYRIYFYNPNNDGAQNWGQGIEPKVTGNGEIPGESSLPFHEFTSRLYAFHYNPYEKGDAFAIEDEIVKKIEALSRESWGIKYTWVEL
ncbi:hypothetical protein MUN88_02610 [Gracilibacillus caseinilyticus]|uniref:Uncharacterized protein n=1 Tax=Gracilibacillus caseinilyticus TaxID=2932256 RepID=A0ABY4EXP2_9BACI|nr:hypothetical protein [Gracilibacillus caseinilyticus]UOQ49050.1 hypothetical protein MUN88_02610 [Gracilibacillus caseinilyticus]